ncbi:MAG: alpha/beta hydrolase family protein [Caldilineaceae bacterium]
MTQLFQSEQQYHQRFRMQGRRFGFQAASNQEWQLWQRSLRAKIRELLGLDLLLPTALNAQITEMVQCDGYRRQRVEIDTEPGITMPLYVLIPDNLSGTAPGVIAAHGHASGGKLAIAGIRGVDAGVDGKIAEHNYDYGVQAVRRGYVVFCPDARGFGERRESLSAGPTQMLDSSCRQLSHIAQPLGLTVAGMWTWDLMVLLDYMQTRTEVQGRKLGSIGLSGGGAQTLWLAALDERVQCAVISGYFYGVEDSLLYLSANCDCNYIPHMWENADIGDVGALIAPRPLLIEAARQDPLNGPRGIANVEEQVAITRRAYDLLSVSERLTTDYFDGGHVWHGASVFDWLDRWLRE